MGKHKMMCKSGDQGLMGIEGRASNLDVESRKIFQEEATAKLQLYRTECLEEEQRLQREKPLSRESRETLGRKGRTESLEGH